MQQETISISTFRQKLRTSCKSVRSGKKKITVTRYREPCFEVVQIQENQSGVDFGLIELRDRVSDFLDLLEQHQVVFLTAWNKRKVACVKL